MQSWGFEGAESVKGGSNALRHACRCDAQSLISQEDAVAHFRRPPFIGVIKRKPSARPSACDVIEHLLPPRSRGKCRFVHLAVESSAQHAGAKPLWQALGGLGATVQANPRGAQHDADLRVRRQQLMQQRCVLEQGEARRPGVGTALGMPVHVLVVEHPVIVKVQDELAVALGQTISKGRPGPLVGAVLRHGRSARSGGFRWVRCLAKYCSSCIPFSECCLVRNCMGIQYDWASSANYPFLIEVFSIILPVQLISTAGVFHAVRRLGVVRLSRGSSRRVEVAPPRKRSVHAASDQASFTYKKQKSRFDR